MLSPRHLNHPVIHEAQAVVTESGSPLAQSLQERGWVVRAGWRTNRSGASVWLVRLVCPTVSTSPPNVAACPSALWAA